jgi:hypothetical protein
MPDSLQLFGISACFLLPESSSKPLIKQHNQGTTVDLRIPTRTRAESAIRLEKSSRGRFHKAFQISNTKDSREKNGRGRKEGRTTRPPLFSLIE